MHSNRIDVVEVSKGFLSCQAMDDILSGSFLTDLWGPVLHYPHMYTVQVDINKHVEPRGPLKRFNHSCEPNARFIYECRNVEHSDLDINDGVFWHVIALRDIKKGEDVTLDYTTTEYDMAQGFQCKCKAKNCLGEVKGFKYLSSVQQRERINNASPATLKCWNKRL
ncbi:uncharacterized protein [Montipora capricornis]|uniref:uncharacterized protein n=1 Tax=Montipora foliosa TaxID=591990 RepID=UPI0035F20DF8